jgi:hypothetical protein
MPTRNQLDFDKRRRLPDPIIGRGGGGDNHERLPGTVRTMAVGHHAEENRDHGKNGRKKTGTEVTWGRETERETDP